jgi:hypothetical protein
MILALHITPSIHSDSCTHYKWSKYGHAGLLERKTNPGSQRILEARPFCKSATATQWSRTTFSSWLTIQLMSPTLASTIQMVLFPLLASSGFPSTTSATISGRAIYSFHMRIWLRAVFTVSCIHCSKGTVRHVFRIGGITTV